MESAALWEGFTVGFMIAAPVGPIGVLCIRRTLADGQAHGLVSGLGAATVHACYAGIAGFGLTFLASFLAEQHGWLRLGGSALLCYLGLRIFRTRAALGGAPSDCRSLARAYASALCLAIANPMTVLPFVAFAAGLSAERESPSQLSAAVLVAGVFLGSALWWVLLSSAVRAVRQWLGAEALGWINRLAGAIIVGFGLLVLLAARG